VLGSVPNLAPLPRAPAATAHAAGHPERVPLRHALRARLLGAESAEPREHRGEPIEVCDDGVRVDVAHETERARRFERGGGFAALGAGAAKSLPPIVAISRGGFCELQVRPEERAPRLVREGAVSTWHRANEGIACDERPSCDMKGIESMMSKTSRVHGSLLARSAGPRP